MSDMVNHPSHYTSGKIECLDAIESMSGVEDFCGYLRASIVKYLWRAKLKGAPLQDIKKAQFYMNKLVDTLTKAQAEEGGAPASLKDLLNQTNEIMADMPFKEVSPEECILELKSINDGLAERCQQLEDQLKRATRRAPARKPKKSVPAPKGRKK